jgi:hypothetical protein
LRGGALALADFFIWSKVNVGIRCAVTRYAAARLATGRWLRSGSAHKDDESPSANYTSLAPGDPLAYIPFDGDRPRPLKRMYWSYFTGLAINQTDGKRAMTFTAVERSAKRVYEPTYPYATATRASDTSGKAPASVSG